jgi:sortase A
MDTQRLLQWTLGSVERLLLGIGALALAYFTYVSAESMLYQAFENRELDAILAAPASARPVAAQGEPRPRAVPARRSVIGRMEIPRLNVSAVVRAGSDSRTLQLAVGHIPGTAVPGEAGNVGLAGHRDTFFRRLRNIRNDDEIRIATPEGTYVYRVARTDIVKPRDVWVLDPTVHPTLTLVTCYPFSYIGSAPQRFVVRAELSRVIQNRSVSS